MLKFINLKKLTAKTLFGVLIVSSFIAGTSGKKAVAAVKYCGNNGHGNNAPFTHKLATGKLTIGQYDPENPGSNNVNGTRNKLIADLIAGNTVAQSGGGGGNYYITFKSNSNVTTSTNSIGVYSLNADVTKKAEEAIRIVDAHPDWEINGSTKQIESGCGDQDSDGIEDSVELGNDYDVPVDTDNDDIPNYADTDSDNDGILDIVEGTGDSDGDGKANYIDAKNNASLTLTGTIRDFKASHPDFEFNLNDGDSVSWSSTIETDKGIVTDTLGSDKKPVYAGESGNPSTSNENNFNQWFRNVSGVNQNKQHSITLTEQDNGTYIYTNNSFFPINGELWGNLINDSSITAPTSSWMKTEWDSGKKNNNYHFTYEIHTKFTYQPGQTFTFSGDDDVWVYINNRRVIDLGGVHGSQNESVNLDNLGLTAGQTYDLDFFFAERNFSASNFTITTNIALQPGLNPEGDEDKDGISNQIESYGLSTDTDNDGTPDFRDTDSDGDGILDSVETGNDSTLDTDTIPNFRDTDSDGDGILDSVETGSDSTLDSDTDPNFLDLDSDGDNIPDSDEGSTDSTLDDDTLPNYLDSDSDGDGIPDLNERVADSNDEGGASDIPTPTSPKTLDNVDGDSMKNYLDLDSDGDGIKDNVDSAPYIPQAD